MSRGRAGRSGPARLPRRLPRRVSPDPRGRSRVRGAERRRPARGSRRAFAATSLSRSGTRGPVCPLSFSRCSFLHRRNTACPRRCATNSSNPDTGMDEGKKNQKRSFPPLRMLQLGGPVTFAPRAAHPLAGSAPSLAAAARALPRAPGRMGARGRTRGLLCPNPAPVSVRRFFSPFSGKYGETHGFISGWQVSS